MEPWLIVFIAVLFGLIVSAVTALVTNFLVRRSLVLEIELVGIKFSKGYTLLVWKDGGNPQKLPIQYALLRKHPSEDHYEQIVLTTDTSFIDAPEILNVQYTYVVVDVVATKKGKQNRVSNRVLYTP